MIKKIFYSLVLFPNIQYKKNFNNYFLEKIEEISLGNMHLVFKDSNDKKHNIFFVHKNYINKKEKINVINWKIYGENKELEKNIKESLSNSLKKDFNFFEEKKYYKDIPFGVVLTITSKCNIFCYYCFNDIDYDLKERNKRKNLGLDDWKKIIDNLYENKTRVVILTGGEPFLADFFWDILDYLKQKGFFIHINTNGTLFSDEILKKLNDNYSVNIMVSMHEFNNKDYLGVNLLGLKKTFGIEKIPDKFNNMFLEKVTQLRKINNFENITLEFLTILNRKNILNLEKVYEFGKNCGINIHNWQFFRFYGTKNNSGATKTMMIMAINKIYKLNNKFGFNYKIVDPVPFCVTSDLEKSSKVIDGVLSDSHDVKTIITTDGYIQLMSAYDNNFWHINKDKIKDVFNSDFTKKMLNDGFLPKECKDCLYKDKCKGGSRMDANITYGSYDLLDPLSDISNKIIN
ncbi:MAG: radical SAM protein [Candidatus Gracilibacteria bacterium]|nr:radical SAM protein [Candidatus Gracilibacteria bacterium]